MKYHVNGKGEAAECGASVKPCPLGGEHYATLDEAQFAAELQQLLGNKIAPKPAPDQEQLLDPKVEVKRVLRLLEGTAQSHQFVRALVTEGAMEQLTAENPRVHLDAGLIDHQRAEMLKVVTERYFAEYGAQLAALPPADIFSADGAPPAGSMAEICTMTRATLDESVAQLNRVRLLVTGQPRHWADTDYLRAQGELTTELALARVGEITRQFDAGMSARMAFLEVTNPVV